MCLFFLYYLRKMVSILHIFSKKVFEKIEFFFTYGTLNEH